MNKMTCQRQSKLRRVQRLVGAAANQFSYGGLFVSSASAQLGRLRSSQLDLDAQHDGIECKVVTCTANVVFKTSRVFPKDPRGLFRHVRMQVSQVL